MKKIFLLFVILLLTLSFNIFADQDEDDLDKLEVKPKKFEWKGTLNVYTVGREVRRKLGNNGIIILKDYKEKDGKKVWIFEDEYGIEYTSSNKPLNNLLIQPEGKDIFKVKYMSKFLKNKEFKEYSYILDESQIKKLSKYYSIKGKNIFCNLRPYYFQKKRYTSYINALKFINLFNFKQALTELELYIEKNTFYYNYLMAGYKRIGSPPSDFAEVERYGAKKIFIDIKVKIKILKLFLFEKGGQDLLKEAKQYINDKFTEEARETLKTIINDYPESVASANAKALLADLDNAIKMSKLDREIGILFKKAEILEGLNKIEGALLIYGQISKKYRNSDNDKVKKSKLKIAQLKKKLEEMPKEPEEEEEDELE